MANSHHNIYTPSPVECDKENTEEEEEEDQNDDPDWGDSRAKSPQRWLQNGSRNGWGATNGESRWCRKAQVGILSGSRAPGPEDAGWEEKGMGLSRAPREEDSGLGEGDGERPLTPTCQRRGRGRPVEIEVKMFTDGRSGVTYKDGGESWMGEQGPHL